MNVETLRRQNEVRRFRNASPNLWRNSVFGTHPLKSKCQTKHTVDRLNPQPA